MSTNMNPALQARGRALAGALSISVAYWEAMLCDPVMAAWAIFGVELDVFQQNRLRYYWWIMKVIDNSGFSSGKTIVDWLFCQLRCLLLPDQDVGVYYRSEERRRGKEGRT